MKSEPLGPGRRLAAKYSAAERERLIREYGKSGLSKKAFCRQRGVNLATFYGWTRRQADSPSPFAKAVVALPTAAPIEVDLPNGVRIRVRADGDVDRTARLIRQVVAREPNR